MRDRFCPSKALPPQAPRDFARAWQSLHGETVDRNRLRHVEKVDLKGKVVYVKFFHRPRLADLIRNLFTAPRSFSQAEREWRMAAALFKAGLQTVPFAAFGDRRCFFLERKSLLITCAQEGPTLGQVLRKEPERAKRLEASWIDLMQTLFTHRILLPDISLEHILVSKNSLFLLDFHNGKLPRNLNAHHLGRMLGRLWAGARDTLSPSKALRLGCHCLRGLESRKKRREIFKEAAWRGEKWEKRESRKRPHEVSP